MHVWTMGRRLIAVPSASAKYWRNILGFFIRHAVYDHRRRGQCHVQKSDCGSERPTGAALQCKQYNDGCLQQHRGRRNAILHNRTNHAGPYVARKRQAGQLLRYLNTTSSACGTSSTTYPGATPVGYQLTYALQPGSSLEFYWDATAAKWVGMQIYAAYNNH